MPATIDVGVGSIMGREVVVGPNCSIGHYSLIGIDGVVTIGSGVQVGSYCLVESGVSLANEVRIDSYCRLAAGVRIGARSQVLYGASLFERVTVGERCVVGGSLMDDAVLGDDVTFMGQMAHSYRDPGDLEAWDGLVQPSIWIGDKSVVGERAILIGGISIGAGSYVAAGEIVRSDVPSGTVVIRGEQFPISYFRGLIRSRS